MILFRRTRDAARSVEPREWLLLALETIGVVAGILVAFELNEWGQARADTRRHDQLMSRLFEETEADVGFLRSMRGTLQKQLDAESRFATIIGAGQCPEASEWEAVGTLTMMPAMTVPTSTYDELTGAGGLSQIDDVAARNELARFHSLLAWSQKQIDYFRQVRTKPVDESDPRASRTFDAAADEPQRITYDRAALCADQGFRNRIASATRNHLVFVSYFRDVTEQAIKMCAAVGRTLGRPCSPGDAMGGPLKGADLAVASKAASRPSGD